MRYTISLIAASLLTTTAHAEVPAVVTDIPPVHSLVSMVMGDLGTPVLLLDQGADAHDFQLRPSQAQAVQDAGLVVWVGPEMSPWLDRVMDGLGTAAPQVALLAVQGTELREFGAEEGHEDHAHGDHGHDDHGHEEAAKDDHGHDHAHDEHGHDDHGHEGHVHTGTDPHAWLDPANAALWVDAVAAELSRLDPANAATYAANAATAKTRITEAETQAAQALAAAKDRPLIVNHDAYGYFAAHFGLTVLPIAGGNAEAPGAGGLRDLIGSAVGAACVFPEANHDAGLAEQVAADTGAKLGAALDPEGSGLTTGPDLYPALLTGLATTIGDCVKP